MIAVSAEPDAGRDEHIPTDKKQLAKIGEMLFAGIMLQIGVRQERRHRVENRRGGKHVLAVRVQREVGLQGQDGKPEDEHHHVEQKQRDRVLLPVLRTRVQQALDRAKKARARYLPSMIQAQ